jgi:hypothetical protein
MSIPIPTKYIATGSQKIKQYRYLIYHLHWQVSAIVMMPVLYWLDRPNFPLWAALMLSQCFGAFIFWYIDLFIFTDAHSTKQKRMKRSQ